MNKLLAYKRLDRWLFVDDAWQDVTSDDCKEHLLVQSWRPIEYRDIM